MARHDYCYKSQDICVFVKQVGDGWIPERVVIGSAHMGWPAGKYYLLKFATEVEAAEYGHTVAMWVVDNPPARSGTRKRKPKRKRNE